MVNEPQDLVLRLLRELRSGQEEIRKDLQALRARVEDMHQSSITALGMAAHAGVQNNNVRDELDDLKLRIERLEARLATQ